MAVKNVVKVGDTKVVNDTEYICKGFTSSGKPIWRNTELEKAHNVGDQHPTKPWVWTEYKPGRFDWRPVKKTDGNKGTAQPAAQPTAAAGQQKPAEKKEGEKKTDEPKTAVQHKNVEDMTPDELVEYAKTASTDALVKVVNDKKQDKGFRQLAFNELKTRDDYKKKEVESEDLEGGFVKVATPKIQYQTKRPNVEIDSSDLENYTVSSNGKLVHVDINKTRAAYRKRTDDQILDTLNNPNAKAQLRQIAYEEAAARGIPEDKISVRGTLQSLWKSKEMEKQLEDSRSKVVNPDEAVELIYDWKGLDHEKIMEEVFDGGTDPAWLDDNSDIVKRTFKTDTLAGRQRYDTFKDYYQRNPELVPGYLSAQEKVDNLNGDMYAWAKSAKSPIFISAGGAGAGKTFGWRSIVAPTLNLPELKPGDDPKASDWGYVMLTNDDAEDEKAFARTLAKYNGTYIDDNGNERPHILVFDDSDKLLITKSKPLMAMMKKINDGNPEARVFTNPETGKPDVWRGKILIMTNKDIAKIQGESEDAKAIVGRAAVNDIRFTRNETMELLSNRYKYMDLPDCEEAFEENDFTPEEIEDFRYDIYDFMQSRIKDADPAKFTPRAFLSIARHVAPKWKKSQVVRTGKGNIGVDKPWQLTAMSILKAESVDIEKAHECDERFSKENMVKVKEELKKVKAQAKKDGVYDKLFGDAATDAVLFGTGVKEEKTEKKTKKAAKKSEEKKTEKAFNDEMSLREAEEILFGI